MFFKKKRITKNKGSEMVETLLVFPLLLAFVLAFAYGILYYNVQNSVKDMNNRILRQIVTAQEYCAFEYSGTSEHQTISYDSVKTENDSSYARNMIKQLVLNETNSSEKITNSIFYLKLKTYKYDYNDETGVASLLSQEYYDFFTYSPTQFGITGESHPELVGSNWVIGNFVELTVKSAVFSTIAGNKIFDSLTSVNIFGIKKIEIVSSTATVTVKFQIENDICADLNVEDKNKPSTCPNY